MEIKQQKNKRVALYAWGGPGTIELLREKYPNPRINKESFHEIYSKGYLKKAINVLGATDIFVSYSWGFSKTREELHRQYISKKLPLLKRLGLETYGYVQGLNVVNKDFKDQDIFCSSINGSKLPYSRNRNLICPNKPATEKILIGRVADAAAMEFDNVYMDNIMFGISPLSVSDKGITSFGCHCAYCRKKFKLTFGYDLPVGYLKEEQLSDFLDFRKKTTTRLIAKLSSLARSRGKGFGVNLYDPFFHSSLVFFGYSFKAIREHLDYYLFENHSIQKGNSIDNSHLLPLIQQTSKPVFVLSYKDGIGIDGQYSQGIVDAIFSEAEQLKYSPCLKASEFKTKGIWHTLNVQKLKTPSEIRIKTLAIENLNKKYTPLKRYRKRELFVNVVNNFYPELLNFVYGNRLMNYLVHKTKIYTRAVRKRQYYDISRWTGNEP